MSSERTGTVCVRSSHEPHRLSLRKPILSRILHLFVYIYIYYIYIYKETRKKRIESLLCFWFYQANVNWKIWPGTVKTDLNLSRSSSTCTLVSESHSHSTFTPAEFIETIDSSRLLHLSWPFTPTGHWLRLQCFVLFCWHELPLCYATQSQKVWNTHEW